MSRRDERHIKKIKKKINELFIMGNISQEEAEAMAQNEEKIVKAMQNGTDEAGPSTVNNNVSTQIISKKLNEVRREKQPGPVLTLTLERLNGSHMSHEEVRDLVHFSVIGPVVNRPKWAFFRPWKSTSQTVLIRVNCLNDYIENNENSFTFVDDFFSKKWIRMHKDVSDRIDFWQHMVQVPVSIQEQIREKVVKIKNAIAEGKPADSIKMELLMSASDMVENDYPWPTDERIATKKRYKSVSSDSPIFALDCEMCKVRGGQSELTRISLIREDGSVVFDTLVKPHSEIVDYVTKFSGITAEMLKDVDVRLSDVQEAIRAILPPDAILVGHSLEFDLRAMKMAHPYCIDVGLIYNLSGNRRNKTALRTLVYLFLGKDIQGSVGHCSVEDSYAALELYRLKTSSGLIFGNCEFGWNYDEWNRQKDEERRSRESEEAQRNPEEEEVARKRKRVEQEGQVPVICHCGRRMDIECILENCQCQKAPPTMCVMCLAKKEPQKEGEEWIDWADSLLKDTCSKKRPLSYYMVDSNKTAMLGFEHSEKIDLKLSKNFTMLLPSSHLSISEYVSQVTVGMLNYKMALVELDYMLREEEMISHMESEETSEDGELPVVMPLVVEEIDKNIQKIINSAAKFSLIILVFSSPTASVCYLKVKP